MEWADAADVTNKIVLSFFSSELAVINLLWILRVSAVGLGNWSEFFSCFIEANAEIWRKIIYLLR